MDAVYTWQKRTGRRQQITLTKFAEIYILVKNLSPTDARKAPLSMMYGIDCFQIHIGETFEKTIHKNANWLQIIEEEINE